MPIVGGSAVLICGRIHLAFESWLLVSKQQLDSPRIRFGDEALGWNEKETNVIGAL
jgi:hypothetical protein